MKRRTTLPERSLPWCAGSGTSASLVALVAGILLVLQQAHLAVPARL